MIHLLATAGLRLLACAAFAFLFWKMLGAVGLAVSAPLFGVALAKPIFELIAHLRQSTKAMVYSEAEGNYYEHRGFRLKVVEDESHHRWLSVRDVRKVVPALPRDAVLQRNFPEGLRHEAAIRGQAIRADALLVYLEKSTATESIKLRSWLQKDVLRPARNVRHRLGIDDAMVTTARSNSRGEP